MNSRAKSCRRTGIHEDAKYQAFEAIYNKRPRGVNFTDIDQARRLEGLLSRLGILATSESPESEYIHEDAQLAARDKN